MTRDELVADLAQAVQHAADFHPLEDYPPTFVDGQPTPYGVLVGESTLDRLAVYIERLL